MMWIPAPNAFQRYVWVSFIIQMFAATRQAPANVACQQLKDGSLEVRWSSPSSLSYNITKYNVSFTTKVPRPGTVFTNSSEVFGNGDFIYIVENALPYANYTFELRAEASDGTTGKPRTCKVQTWQELPSEPVKLRVTAKTHASLSIAWKAPVNANGGHLEYHIRYSAPGGEVKLINTTQVSYSIGGLESCTKYTIKVSASNDVGEGNPAQTEGATDFDAPEAVKCSQATSDWSLKVSWVPPKESCTIARFDVSYNTSVLWSQEFYSNATSVDESQTEYVLETPASHASYEFEVKAAGDGIIVGDPATCNIITAQTAPSKPQNLTLVEATTESLSMAWEQPAQLNGILQSFLVTWTSDVPGGDGSAVIELQLNISHFSYVITELSAGTAYSVQVQATTTQTGEAAGETYQTLHSDTGTTSTTLGKTEPMSTSPTERNGTTSKQTTATPPTVTTKPPSPSKNGPLSTGAIVGIVIGTVGVVVILAVIGYQCWKRDSAAK